MADALKLFFFTLFTAVQSSLCVIAHVYLSRLLTARQLSTIGDTLTIE